MYPRNSASPPRISIGAVIQISDGAVQTAGVSVVVRPEGGSETAGGGTLSYGATSGVVYYTPTQAETDHTAFVVVAYKTGCIPIEKAIVTSARSTSGEVQVGGYASGQVPLQPTVAGRTLDVSAGGEAGIDLANVGSPTTTVNLSGVTIKTATDVETRTQDVQNRIPSALIDGRIVANAQVVGDKSGYTLTQAFPANFANLGIDGTGAISAVLTVEELAAGALNANGAVDSIPPAVWGYATRTLSAFGFEVTVGGYASGQAPPTVGAIADAVLTESVDDHDGVAHSLAKYISIIKKANTVIDGTVTSAVSPTTTAFTSNINYPTGAFKHAVLLWLTGNLAEQNSPILTYNNTNGAIVVEEAFTEAPAVGDEFIIIPSTHVHSVAAIATAVGDLQVLTRLDSMIESDGAGQFRFDTIALENAPAGGGGGGGTDWTSSERAAIRSIIGFTSAGAIADPTVGILDEIRDKTSLITSGNVQTSIPVTAQGQINGPLYIGDDYLTANGRAFQWTVALPSGYVLGTSTCRFGARYEDELGVSAYSVTGTVTDAGSGNVTLAFELPKGTTGLLRPGYYQWSVEIVSASGIEITRVASSDRKLVEWKEKQT